MESGEIILIVVGETTLVGEGCASVWSSVWEMSFVGCVGGTYKSNIYVYHPPDQMLLRAIPPHPHTPLQWHTGDFNFVYIIQLS